MHSYCVVKILSVLPPPRCSPGSFHVCGMCSLKFSLTSPLFSTSVGPQHSAFELGIPSFVFFFFFPVLSAFYLVYHAASLLSVLLITWIACKELDQKLTHKGSSPYN